MHQRSKLRRKIFLVILRAYVLFQVTLSGVTINNKEGRLGVNAAKVFHEATNDVATIGFSAAKASTVIKTNKLANKNGE